MTADATTVCTFTNTRKAGKIKVIKDLIPASDAGRFDLKVGDDVVADGIGDGGAGEKTVAPGTHTVSEAGDATDLAKYATSIACDNGAKSDGASVGVTVDSDEIVTCVVTNERKSGKLKVVKRLLPAGDAGKFDLKIGDAVVADGVGDGGAGEQTVAPGTYKVSELGDGTDLAKYNSSIACDNDVSADGTSADVTVDSNETVTCTITNTRRTGTIKVVKSLIPATDAGRFDLMVGQDVVADGAGDAGQGSKTVQPGTYMVSEAGDNTELAGYLSSVACDNDVTAVGTSAEVTVDSDETVTCTITNTRKADLTVTKTEGESTDAVARLGLHAHRRPGQRQHHALDGRRQPAGLRVARAGRVHAVRVGPAGRLDLLARRRRRRHGLHPDHAEPRARTARWPSTTRCRRSRSSSRSAATAISRGRRRPR